MSEQSRQNVSPSPAAMGAGADYRRDLARELNVTDVPLPKNTIADLKKIARQLDRAGFVLAGAADDVRPYSARISILAERCSSEASVLCELTRQLFEGQERKS